jgi:TolB protein
VTQLTDAPGVDRGPAWSPDGSWILFSSNRDHVVDGARSTSEVYRMRPDGSDEERVTSDLRRADEGPSWSPNGELIAWTGAVGKPNQEAFRGFAVHVMKGDGSGVTRVTGRRLSSSGAEFSPDGRWLVFYGHPSRAADWDYALYKSRPDGSHRSRLTRVGTHWSYSDW